jgi:hypothetical protein
MKIRTLLYIVVLFVLFTLSVYSQQYSFPVTIPPSLSANFGELRSNHFHSGVDFKTQQTVNKPIVAIEDGYVSRISVSPGGYGLAIYIDHPSTGHTSVYAHLNSFNKEIAEWVKEKQYEQERYQITLYPEKGKFPVKRGEQIALSGNTGSSGGPHLHFEIRDTQTEEPLDALVFLPPVTDTQKPDLQGIAFYPYMNMGLIQGSNNPLRINIAKDSNGNPLKINRVINAWGRIGVGVKAYDRMNGQSNIYGVKHIRLFVDEKLVFSSSIDRFSFSDTRMLNSFVDFEDWKKRRSFYMKSFIEPGNRLSFFKTANNGYIDIIEEREYLFRYELEDYLGNRLDYRFSVMGKPQEIPSLPPCDNWFSWNLNNSFLDLGFSLTVPTGNLYSDICFKYSKTESQIYYSHLHQVNDIPVPLHRGAEMWIALHTDTLQNKSNYGIVRINENGSESWIGGNYKRGGISKTIQELGDMYTVSSDTFPPVITPISPENWVKQRRINIRLSDNKSGVSSFRGEINGKFVLFTHDSKSNVYSYVFDDERIKKGEQMLFVFTASDSAGNSSEYKRVLQ